MNTLLITPSLFVLTCIIVVIIKGDKNRNTVLLLLLSPFIGAIVGIIIALLLPSKTEVKTYRNELIPHQINYQLDDNDSTNYYIVVAEFRGEIHYELLYKEGHEYKSRFIKRQDCTVIIDAKSTPELIEHRKVLTEDKINNYSIGYCRESTYIITIPSKNTLKYF